MGCSQSKGNFEKEKNRKISKELKKDFSRDSKIIKLLLLGAGESGKSTIVKQMKLLHPVNSRKHPGFSEDEIAQARLSIFSNILNSITQLLVAHDVFGLSLESPELESDKARILEVSDAVSVRKNPQSCLQETLDDQLVEYMTGENPISEPICRLWKSTSIQNCFHRRSEIQLYDNTSYFMNSIERICSTNFVPTHQDILQTRIQTKAVVKIEFEYEKSLFNMYDVGGQRTERKKWIQCFDNVNAVLFVVSLSEYDQVLYEDQKTNRMEESLNLFSEMVNNSLLKLIPFIVFFNKKDLFDAKILEKSIKSAFPDYTGPQRADDCARFIMDKYLSKNKRGRQIYSHQTTATDTELVWTVFVSVSDIILKNVLRETGLN